MKRKTVNVTCDAPTAQQLGTAIRAYTNAAYPLGGSECAQVARAALLDAAVSCDAHEAGDLALRRRQLALLRACVRWYFAEEGPGDVKWKAHLETLLAANNKSTS